MNKRILPALVALGSTLIAGGAWAVPSIPEESGWSGHINLGIGVGSSESNLIAGVSSIDLGKEKISSLEDGPDNEDFVLPMAHFELAYTLGNNRTQLYFGNQEADYLSFDLETTLRTHLGVRQDVPGITRLEISLSASSLPLDVWKDPYVVDEKRGDTERTSSGVHLSFDNILGTPFELEWSSVEVEIDDERSGEGLGLSKAQQSSLSREGQVYNLELSYDWKINERHRLVPVIGWVDHDLDGAAMAEDGVALVAKHLYERGQWLLVSQVFFQDLESDDTNPIYDEKGETDILGGSFTAFYRKPFGLKHWTANATIGYQDEDSNIDFYDSTFGVVSVGMFYRFD